MKTKIAVATLGFIFGTVAASFAGNHPALTYPSGSFATTGTMVQTNPWGKGFNHYQGGIVVAASGNGICPVMNHRITSKHNATIALSNGKYMNVCCSPCKQTVEKDLDKYKANMF